jgi:dTDP-4-dehydrorhamnose 3,5-epimerase
LKIEHTYLKGCFLIHPTIYKDKRGTFHETFNLKEFKHKTGLDIHFVQDNQSVSKKGVLRGFHFQNGEHAQSKLVRVIKGEIQDVVVDIRKDSETFGQHFSIKLSEENNLQLFIPEGFAHAFLCLTDEVIFSYKCDRYYHKDSEQGIIYNDKDLNVEWELPESEFILSEKDLNLPVFNKL